MSLAGHEHREPYIDLLTRPILDALGDIEGMLDEAEDPMINQTMVIDRVLDEMQKVDWENKAVPPPTAFELMPGLDAHDRTATGHAERLVSAAFRDAEFLFVRAQYAVNRAGIVPEAGFGGLLLNSERTLLPAARLGDRSKDRLFRAVELGNEMGAVVMGFAYEQDTMIIRRDTKGHQLVDWSPKIASWIRDRRSVYGGCPAHEKIVEVNDRKMTLMHFFWEKLVRSSYPVEN